MKFRERAKSLDRKVREGYAKDTKKIMFFLASFADFVAHFAVKGFLS
jgi:hypothetical protein